MKINSLHLFLEAVAKSRCKTFPTRRPDPTLVPSSNRFDHLYKGPAAATGQSLISPEVRELRVSERESAATSGPDALLQTAFIIFCPPGSGSDKSPVIPERPGPDREREGGKGEAGLEEVQTKFGSFMIYDRQTGESRITFPGPLSASCLIFPRAPTSPGLILPDAGHLSRLLSPSSCQPRVSSFTWFSPSTAQVGVSSVTPSQHQRPSQILSGLYFHILVSPFPSWEWWEYRNQKLI